MSTGRPHSTSRSAAGQPLRAADSDPSWLPAVVMAGRADLLLSEQGPVQRQPGGAERQESRATAGRAPCGTGSTAGGEQRTAAGGAACRLSLVLIAAADSPRLLQEQQMAARQPDSQQQPDTESATSQQRERGCKLGTARCASRVRSVAHRWEGHGWCVGCARDGTRAALAIWARRDSSAAHEGLFFIVSSMNVFAQCHTF